MNNNPIYPVIENICLWTFLKRLLKKRYKDNGVENSDTIIDKIFSIMYDYYTVSLDVTQRTIYREYNFQSTNWKSAYAKYSNLYKYQFVIEQIDRLPLQHDAVILDWGAGTNSLGDLLIKDHAECNVVGIDVEIYPNLITHDNLDFIQQTKATEVPKIISDKSVDLIIMNGVAHHIKMEDFSSIIKSMKRVLKPNGLVMIIEDTYSEKLTVDVDYDKDFTQGFFNLSYNDRQNFFKFICWYGNILVNRLDGMPRPENFNTVEDWIKIFKSNKLIPTRIYTYGFLKGMLHKPPQAIMVFKNGK